MPLKTTVGQLVVNEALPPKYRDYERVLIGPELDDLLARIGQEDPGKYREITHKLVQLGREASFREGTTLSLDDLQPPAKFRQEVFDHVEAQEAKIAADTAMSPADKREALTKVHELAQKLIVDKTYDLALKAKNPLALQILSKARGNPAQLAALLATPGTFSDAKGQAIPIFARHSYAEGLTPWEYYAATFGARKGIISTKFCLAAGTEVLLADYSIKTIENIVPGDVIFTVDDQLRLVKTIVTGFSDNGLRECWSFRFRQGRSRDEFLELPATEEHKVLLGHMRRDPAEWVRNMEPLKVASKGRRAACLAAGEAEGCGKVEPFAGTIGALLGDGSISQHNANLYVSDPSIIVRLSEELLAENMVFRSPVEMESGIFRYHVGKLGSATLKDNFDGNPLITRLRELGLMGHRAPTKFIPQDVWSWDRQSCERLAAMLLETDGCITHVTNGAGLEYPIVSFYCTSEQLAKGFKRLLQTKLGVVCAKLSCRAVAGREYVFKLATDNERRGMRNYDLYGFNISTRTAVAKVTEFWRGTGHKAALLQQAVDSFPAKYKEVHGNQYISRTYLGLRQTYDLEIDNSNHRYVLANGMIVSNSTRDAGDLGKQMNNVSAGLMITEDDCGSTNGIPVDIDDPDNAGAVLARATSGIPLGAPLTSKNLKALKAGGVKTMLVRSPVTCQTKAGLCKQCAGIREDGRLPELRDAIGIKASSALAERIAQGALNLKHTAAAGGGGKVGDQLYAGFDIINQLGQVPTAFRHAAALAEIDGPVTKIEPAAQGGTNIYIGEEVHYVEPEQVAMVKIGDELEAGDQMSTGIVNPAEVVRHKGIGEGRRYFSERLTQAYKDSGLAVNRRNVEVLSRALIDHVLVDDPEGLGEYLPGDVASYSALAYGYRPRADSQIMQPDEAVGKFLEQPALQHTIGARVTKRMLGELKQFEVDKINVHDVPPAFTPQMRRMRTAAQYGKDWLAKLHGTYLKSNLLGDVQGGAESDVHGTHPVPAVAYGVELGRSRPGQITY